MNHVIAFALRQRVLVLLMFIALLCAGFAAFARLNIEAYPDPVPPLVDIITQSPGQSAEEMERYITVPLEVQLAGIPHLTAMRTISLFGLSDVKLQFTYDYTYEEAEQKVLNRLSQLPPLPNNAQPQISPWSPIGEILRYRLVGPPGYSVLDLKTLQDWVLERRFKGVPGVIDVNGFGGKTKTYEINVDPYKLQAFGITLPQLVQTLNNSNINVGGQTVNISEQSAVVRGIGLIRSLDDIRNTTLTQQNGLPIRISDVAGVTVGYQPRLGIVGQDDADDIVQGIVLMRRGAQSLPTITRVAAEIDKINSGSVLPPGVRIERIYDRRELISVTTHTVLHNMVLGIVLVFIFQWLFIGNIRSAVIVAATIPFALFFAVSIIVIRGDSANLLSVGAIDFGLIVDGTVIMVESIYAHLAERPAIGIHDTSLASKNATIYDAARKVSRSIFFSAAIVIAGFVPLFTLSGVEGHIFGPMSQTYAYAIAGGLLAAFTVSPALSSLLLPAHVEERETLVVRALRRIYRPALSTVVAHAKVALAFGVLLLLLTGFVVRQLGLEFLPKLEEGNLWIRATMPASISLEAGNVYVNKMRRLIAKLPEAVTVISQQGRPDDGTDATGFFNAEFFVPLRPQSTWPKGKDKYALTKELSDQLEEAFPGVEFNFSQYIEDNVEEAVSGVKGENSVKVFGNDLNTLNSLGAEIKNSMATVAGITDLAVFTSLGQPTVQIAIDRDKAGRYGLSPGDINTAVQTAIGGQAAGDLYEHGSDRHFNLRVRLAPPYRRSIESIRDLTIDAPNPNGSGTVRVPLTDLAQVEVVPGPSFIYREAQERYLPIKFSVRGRDLGSTVIEAQQKIADKIKLLPGYRLEWVGEFANLQDAIDRLKVVVPLSIGLIAILLYINFSSVADMLLGLSVIPMALIGGILALFLTGTPFSISAAIGFIALFGISVMGSIIVIAQFNQIIAQGINRTTAILRTGELQMRPVILICVIAGVGLLPAAISTGIGSQVQKPLAVVVVGGMLLAPALILLILPVLIKLFSRRDAQNIASRDHGPQSRPDEPASPQPSRGA
jgi:heavy metal efflux system protein